MHFTSLVSLALENIYPKVLINLPCPAAVQRRLIWLFVSAGQYSVHRNTNERKQEPGKCIGAFHMHISRIIFLLSCSYSLIEQSFCSL